MRIWVAGPLKQAGGYETGMVGAVDDRMSDSDTKTLALAGKGGEGGAPRRPMQARSGPTTAFVRVTQALRT